AVYYADDIRARLPLDVQNYSGRIVLPGRLFDVFSIVDDIGYISEPYRCAVSIGDDQLLVAVARDKLIIGSDGVGLVWPSKLPFSLVYVARRYRRAQILEAQSVRGKRGRICLNSHRRLLSTADRHQANARQLRDSLSQPRVGQVLHFGQRQGRRSQSERQNRSIRGIGLTVSWRIGEVSRQERRSGVDRCLDLLFGNIDVQVQCELKSNHRSSKRAGGGHLIQAGQLSELPLEWGGDGRAHHVRAGSGIEREYLNCWIINLRQCGDRQLLVGDDARKENSGHQQRRSDRPQDERTRWAHAFGPESPVT